VEVLADRAWGDSKGSARAATRWRCAPSPQVGFSPAMSRMSLRRSLGRRGLPANRDFHRQNRWNPLPVPVRFDAPQRVTPREHAAQNHHNQSSGIVRLVWLRLPLFEQARAIFAASRLPVGGLETSTRRRTRSRATDDRIVRLRVNVRKMGRASAPSFTRYATLRDFELAAERNFCGRQQGQVCVPNSGTISIGTCHMSDLRRWGVQAGFSSIDKVHVGEIATAPARQP
jgi:hypothetical protein